MQDACGRRAGRLPRCQRERVVTSLAAEAAEAAASEGVRFAFMDASGAIKGYATGRPEGGPAPAIAWQLGVDLAAVAEACRGIEAIAYAADPKRIRLDLEAYGALLTDGSTLAAALRPMLPDCDSAANLAAKLRLAPRARPRARRPLPLRPRAACRPRPDPRGARRRLSPPQRTARELAGVAAVVDDEPAVDGRRRGSLRGAARGSSYVAVSRTVSGSKQTRSATIPGRTSPRSGKPSRCAGSEVIFRIACSHVRMPSSRTYTAR